MTDAAAHAPASEASDSHTIDWLLLAGAVVSAIGYVVSLHLRAGGEAWLSLGLGTVLMGLATICLLTFPMVVGVTAAAVAFIVLLWGWGQGRTGAHFAQAAACAALFGFTSWQQRWKGLRVQRLGQAVEDIHEELYMKEQALTISNQSHDSLERKLFRYQQLQAIAERLSRLVSLDEIAQLAVDRAFELIGKSEVCLLYLVDTDRHELALRASHKGPQISSVRTKQGDEFDHYVLRTQRPLLVNEVRRDFRFSVAETAERQIASVIACPVMIAGKAEGVLRLDSPKAGVYTQDDLRFLDILLDLVDTAVANARLFAQTQQLAVTDWLTGLFRRQPFAEQLVRELARAGRGQEPLAVLMLDIDDFKLYNDTYGHTAGDVVLKHVAQICRITAPPGSMCARYGGEEFVLLLPKIGRAEAAAVAERIRERVSATSHTTGHLPDSPVTVSLGLAVFPEDAHSDLELIRRADERLYQAKRSGKNTVVAG